MKYIKIDNQGFYIEDVVLKEPPFKTQMVTKTKYELTPEYDEEGNLISEEAVAVEYEEIENVLDESGNPVLEDGFVSVECFGGFHHPKWNGTEWVEGLTQEEIDARTQPVVTGPTLEEMVMEHDTKIVTLEQTVGTIFGGVE